MKRTDLKVGQTYLASRYNDWEKHLSSSAKVTVVSLKPLGFRRARPDAPPFVLTLDDGTTVELPRSVTDQPSYGERALDVAVRYEDGSHGTEPTRNIRGLWDECRAIQEKVRSEDRARLRSQREAEQERARDLVAITERLRAAGVEGYISPNPQPGRHLELTYNQVTTLLDRIERKG